MENEVLESTVSSLVKKGVMFVVYSEIQGVKTLQEAVQCNGKCVSLLSVEEKNGVKNLVMSIISLLMINSY